MMATRSVPPVFGVAAAGCADAPAAGFAAAPAAAADVGAAAGAATDALVGWALGAGAHAARIVTPPAPASRRSAERRDSDGDGMGRSSANDVLDINDAPLIPRCEIDQVGKRLARLEAAKVLEKKREVARLRARTASGRVSGN